MLPSLRLLAYVALGGLLLLAGAWAPEFWLLALLFDVGLLVAATADLIFSPRPNQIEIERELGEKMNLGVANVVTLRARNRSHHKIRLVLRDEVPSEFAVATEEPLRWQDGTPLPVLPRAVLILAPHSEAEGNYHLIPNRRGDFMFGALAARYPTVLGLWHRQFSRAGGSAQARVYPDTTSVRRYELALREGKLRDLGLHLLRLRGRGTEFESLRDYTSDDEFKSINWNASARRGKLISTDYEIERDQTILICLDCGRMMTSLAVSREVAPRDSASAPQRIPLPDPTSFSLSAPPSIAPVTPLSKLDCAINATVLLAHIAASMGDNVGLLLFSDQVLHYLAPRKGRLQTGAIIEALYSAQPSLVEPDYLAAYEHILSRKLRRALVVTFTDIIDPEASRELLQASAALRRHHNALCVTLANHDVLEMAHQVPQIASEFYEKAMAQKMLSERESALEALRAVGVAVLDAESSALSVAAVNRYLEMKSRGTL